MIDALLATLERDAAAEIGRVVAAAHAEAAAIAEGADRALAARRREALARRETERRGAAEVALGAARRSARERVLTARSALLERVFAAIEAQLPTVGAGAAYEGAAAQDLIRALAFTGDAAVVVHCAPALAPALRRAVRRNGHLTIRRDRALGAGFRVTTADGAMEVDETLTGRVQRLRARLAVAALAALRSAG